MEGNIFFEANANISTLSWDYALGQSLLSLDIHTKLEIQEGV